MYKNKNEKKKTFQNHSHKTNVHSMSYMKYTFCYLSIFGTPGACRLILETIKYNNFILYIIKKGDVSLNLTPTVKEVSSYLIQSS